MQIPESYRQIELQSLKTRLRSIFPCAKSSHITESIAYALGFNSNAAFRAAGIVETVPRTSFEPIRFCERMDKFQDEWVSLPSLASQPRGLAELIKQSALIGRLPFEASSHAKIVESIRTGNISREVAKCVAEALLLGDPVVPHPDRSALRLGFDSIDHSNCLPGWGGSVSPERKGFLEPMFKGHPWRFERKLPLANGKMRSYTEAVLTISHDRGRWESTQRPGAERHATVRGWVCTRLVGWFGDAEPLLIRRSTSHEQMHEMWNHSFVRWVCSNQEALKLVNSSEGWQLAVEDVMECPHIPLDVEDFDDLMRRYLAEVPYPTLNFPDIGQTAALNILLQLWHQKRG
jgi:hypothetical protein